MSVIHVDAGANGFVDTGIAEGVAYYYRIYAVGPNAAVGDTPVSNSVSIPTEPIDELAAPTGLHRIAPPERAITIGWTDNSSIETAFRVYRKQGNGAWESLGSEPADQVEYLDRDYNSRSDSIYKVRAIGAVRESADSNILEIPAKPDAPTITDSATDAITLSWIDRSTLETGYHIERRSGSTGEWTRITTTPLTANSSTYVDDSVSPNASYHYRVRAITDSAEGLASPATPALSVASGERLSVTHEPAKELSEGMGLIFVARPVTGQLDEGTTYVWTVLRNGLLLDADISTSTSPALAFTVADDGVYDVTVIARPTTGSPRYGLDVVEVDNVAPTLVLNGAPHGEIGAPYELGFVHRDPGADAITQILVDWGDNSDTDGDGHVGQTVMSANSTVGHIYAQAGEYTIHAVATDEDGTYTFPTLDVSVVADLATLPAAPVAIWIGNQTSSSAIVRWHMLGEDLSGQLQWSKHPDFFGASSVTVAAGAESYELTGLAAGETYFVRVRARNAWGASAWAQQARFITWPGVPESPSDLNAEGMSSSAIHVSWTRAAGAGEYLLQRSQGGGGSTTIATLGGDSADYVDVGLDADTTYSYTVVAANQSGESDASAPSEATTLPASLETFIAVPVSSRKLALGLDPNTVGLEVQRSPNGVDGWETFTLAELFPEAPVQYGSAELEPETTYYFRARRTNSHGSTDWSSIVSAQTLPLTPPYLYEAWSDGDAFALYWDHQLDEEDGFRIECSTDGQNYEQLETTGQDETYFYDDSGTLLSPDKHYRFRVVTTRGEVESEPSNVVEFWTEPAAPTNLTTNAVNESEINLSWADNSELETGYQIEVSADGGETFRELAVTAPNATGYAVIGLEAQTAYTFHVTALRHAARTPERALQCVQCDDAPAPCASRKRRGMACGH
ncbi:MAG: fibronectin type III domain-containing protein [Nibricoccus sp.]